MTAENNRRSLGLADELDHGFLSVLRAMR